VLLLHSGSIEYAEKTNTTFILVSDKAWFHLSEYVNSITDSSAQYPVLFHEVSLLDF